ncbi:uncharacterized protein LOC110029008 [Phalaenopsis equestris]|uniref:uncharacterized protein LOC110029008 n=1 Tax=Phalaenopsis equestris TaxID=78828 RepID=UPI0009E3C723|nr:uncharacterized protein LOC110029008 [Phalaenopsis equestris]
MGFCNSCKNKAAVSIAASLTPTTTAKLVLEDGRLLEFNRPVKVSEILKKFQISPMAAHRGRNSKAFFVCDADGMGMEGVLPAVGEEEELKAEQLYFLLPLSMMGRRLRPPEMAELACKASSALINSDSGIAPMVFPAECVEPTSVQRREVVKKVRSGDRRVTGGASRLYFKLELGVIPEYLEEEEEC